MRPVPRHVMPDVILDVIPAEAGIQGSAARGALPVDRSALS